MQRAAIVLRFYEDLSEADTAEALGTAAGHGEVDRFPRARTPAPSTGGGGVMETRLRDLLRDLATEMPVDVKGAAP